MTLTYIRRVSERQDSKKPFSLQGYLTLWFETILRERLRDGGLGPCAGFIFHKNACHQGAQLCSWQSAYLQCCLVFLFFLPLKDGSTVISRLPIQGDCVKRGSSETILQCQSSLECFPGWGIPTSEPRAGLSAGTSRVRRGPGPLLSDCTEPVSARCFAGRRSLVERHAPSPPCFLLSQKDSHLPHHQPYTTRFSKKKASLFQRSQNLLVNIRLG